MNQFSNHPKKGDWNMIIDCHDHLEERLLSREERLQRMDKAGVEKAALMGAMMDPFPDPGMRRRFLGENFAALAGID
jgi:hypothetical protein